MDDVCDAILMEQRDDAVVHERLIRVLYRNFPLPKEQDRIRSERFDPLRFSDRARLIGDEKPFQFIDRAAFGGQRSRNERRPSDVAV